MTIPASARCEQCHVVILERVRATFERPVKRGRRHYCSAGCLAAWARDHDTWSVEGHFAAFVPHHAPHYHGVHWA